MLESLRVLCPLLKKRRIELQTWQSEALMSSSVLLALGHAGNLPCPGVSERAVRTKLKYSVTFQSLESVHGFVDFPKAHEMAEIT